MKISDSLLGFEVLSTETRQGIIERTDYKEIEAFNAHMREKCEERALMDKRAEVIAIMTFTA